ncbi:hypothetical protein [Sphingopyxis sp. 550A]
MVAFTEGDTRYDYGSWPQLGAGSHIVADIENRGAADKGPILSFGTSFSGYALKLEAGRPVFVYDPTGRSAERRIVKAATPLQPGRHSISVSFRAIGDETVELLLAVDGHVSARAEMPSARRRISAAPGYVGRRAEDDFTGPEKCDCSIEQVSIIQD